MAARGTVVVTGSSTGIGRATALRLAAGGFEVLAGVRREADGEALVKDAGTGTIVPVPVDVTDGAQVAALGERLAGKQLAGLVNNAGVSVNAPLEFVELDELRRQLEVNLVGQVAVTQALLEPLRAAPGRIVNVTSIGGRFASPFLGPYVASKFAFEGLSDTLRRELRPWGIHVAMIEPGSIATEIWDKGTSEAQVLIDGMSPRARELYGKRMQGALKLADRAARTAIPPDRVARKIEHALTASRPKTRYLVGPDAHVQMTLQRVLTDKGLDRVIGLLTRG
jgi:NAD(P)-dependent dehydrogenase (short-subunit alcohol dehydrogenase family)